MKALFIDHQFHRKTRSSHFFLEFLKPHFEVIDVLYVNPEEPTELEALEGPRQHQLVVIWQLDFLAPAFLSAGYATIVVPMFDGSFGLPWEHWIAIRDASFVCFSRTFHERILAAGGRSFLVKYFLPPCDERQLPRFDRLNGILWMRRPQDGLTPKLVERLVGNQLKRLHVHNAPDDFKPRDLSSPEYAATSFRITESRWSASNDSFRDFLRRANVFIAPRASEGIGIAMLEAMAHGMLVIANDDGVHNEYIANWVNGILFDRFNAGHFHLSTKLARDLAFCGWRGASAGYTHWLDNLDPLLKFITDTEPTVGQRSNCSQDINAAIWDAHLLGADHYRDFLRRHVVNVDKILQEARIAEPVMSLLTKRSAELPVIDVDGLFFGISPNSVARTFGLDRFDAFSSYLSGLSAGFSVSYAGASDTSVEHILSIKYQVYEDTGSPWEIICHLNNALAMRDNLPNEIGKYAFEIRIPTATIDEISIMLTFLSKTNLGSTGASVPSIRFLYAKILQREVI
jgi:Glycosyl transferases group 1